jgi:uncharacterized protein YbjT (DUF2867 family)
MNAVVTGATGFLGGHVTRLLCARGDEVRVTFRNPDRLKHLKGMKVRRASASAAPPSTRPRAARHTGEPGR